MKFHLKAIDETGHEKTVTIEADDEKSALAMAKSHKLFTTKITPIVEQYASTGPLPPKPSTPPVACTSLGPASLGPYQYKMVQVPSHIAVHEHEHKGSEAATYLEEIVNKYAQKGWEFYRIDSLGVTVLPGCLGALFGQSGAVSMYYVITFRRSPFSY